MKPIVFVRRLIVAAVCIGALEFAAREVNFRDPTVLPDPYEGMPGTPPLYHKVVPEQGRPFYERSPNKKKHYRDGRFLAEKSPKEFRVFCIGGSSVRSDAFLWPDGSFPNMLAMYLKVAMVPFTNEPVVVRPNVINAGGGGMGSIQNLEVLRELLDYAPDLLVVYPEGGEKNFIGAGSRAVIAKKDDESPLRVLCRRWLAQLRVYQAVRDLYRLALAPPWGVAASSSAFSAALFAMVAQPFSDSSFTRLFEMKNDRVPPLMERTIARSELDIAYARFQANLREMARLARERDVKLLFVMPIRNLKQSFYLRFHITPEEIRDGRIEDWRLAYEEGCRAKREGRHEDAIRAFERVRRLYLNDDDDILAFYLGECHEARGRPNEALREFSRPYLTHPMRAQIQQVARECGVPVVDPYPALVKATGGLAPGYEWFTDAFHPMPETNRVIALAVLEAMQREGIGGPLRALDSPAMQEAEDSVRKLIAECVPPEANLMLRAILAKDYAEAIRVAERIHEGLPLVERAIEPLYYGWALTRSGQIGKARDLFVTLRQMNFRRYAMASIPTLESDAEAVRIAFEGDLFHYF